MTAFIHPVRLLVRKLRAVRFGPQNRDRLKLELLPAQRGPPAPPGGKMWGAKTLPRQASRLLHLGR
jgi:hypothetical protein